MTSVAKIYELGIKAKEIFNSKLFYTFFILISAPMLFFGVMNTYAQEDTSGTVDISNVTISPSWKGVKAFINLANGTSTDENNMGSQGTLNIANTAYTAIAIMDPGVTEGGNEIKNSGDVPEDMKAGLIGVADNAGTYAYEMYPSTNIGDHLAQEWVPGYKESNTSAYAETSTASVDGYQTLMNSGIAPIWSKVRDLAYLFFVVVMIVVGFMIMFRSKIGGQTLVTLGNFLPGVIVALILITFSFAIAGLLIDLGGLVTSLIAGLYGSENVVGVNSLWSLFAGIFVAGTKTTALTTAFAGGGITGALGLSTLAPVGVAFLSTVFGTVLAGAGIIALLLGLMIMGIIFWGGIKVLITLYKAFFGILLGVIIAPIQLMIGAFPGKGYTSGNWFKTLLKNVLTFPMVFAIVNLPNFIATQAGLDLSLPAKLSYSVNDGMNIGLTHGFGGYLTMFILRVVVLFFAAESPKYLEAWFPPDTPKAVAEGLANAQASLSKIPLVGSLFK